MKMYLLQYKYDADFENGPGTATGRIYGESIDELCQKIADKTFGTNGYNYTEDTYDWQLFKHIGAIDVTTSIQFQDAKKAYEARKEAQRILSEEASKLRREAMYNELKKEFGE